MERSVRLESKLASILLFGCMSLPARAEPVLEARRIVCKDLKHQHVDRIGVVNEVVFDARSGFVSISVTNRSESFLVKHITNSVVTNAMRRVAKFAPDLSADMRSMLEGEIRMATGEILRNAAKWGNADKTGKNIDPDKAATVAFVLEGRVLKMFVTDQSGKYYNPRANKANRQSGDTFDIEITNKRDAEGKTDSGAGGLQGGLGMMIVEGMLQKLEYVPIRSGSGSMLGTKVNFEWDLDLFIKSHS